MKASKRVIIVIVALLTFFYLVEKEFGRKVENRKKTATKVNKVRRTTMTIITLAKALTSCSSSYC